MNKQLAAWTFILDHLTRDTAVMLLYVVESIGSSPGRQGFFMGVAKDGAMAGSIGGGIMEHKFVELAKNLLVLPGAHFSLRRQLHQKNAHENQSGMICSGEQSIIIVKLDSSQRGVIAALVDSVSRNLSGSLAISPQGLSFSAGGDQRLTDASHYHWQKRSDEDWLYSETTGLRHCVHIIGGGHCALALTQVMALAGFYVIVYDDRKNLHTLSQNIYADLIKKVDDYSQLEALINAGYVVVMTFGYRSDEIALRAIMSKKLSYLGVLGSEHKIREMMNKFRNEGIPEEILAKIKAPAGIKINSREPEEIAVSIAAEIIKTKNLHFKNIQAE